MDGEPAVAGPLARWEQLHDEQYTLLRTTFTENEELKAQALELERELSVWKLALKAADEEKVDLQKSVSKLERTVGALREDNPLALALIDGDGCLFIPELLTSGQAGGRQAAMLLTKGITDYLSGLDIKTNGRHQVWLTIYCNKAGLLETLLHNEICTAEQFEGFCLGFNQAHPLFSLIDAGGGKEAADAKIKECLRVFTRFPQTSRVFFGGSHDNGYTSSLTSLENEGLLHKIVLLRSYTDLAVELSNLNLPEIDMKGIFIRRKLPTRILFQKNTPKSPLVQLQDLERSRAASFSLGPRPVRYPDPKLPLSKRSSLQRSVRPSPNHLHTCKPEKPPPCNFHYLGVCKQGSKCIYGHDYVLSEGNLNELRENAKKSPCHFVNKDLPCPLGDTCCSGHICPKGPKCPFHKQGKCRFLGKDMHTRSHIPQPKNKKRPVAPSSSGPSVTEELPGTFVGSQIDRDVASWDTASENGWY